MTETAGYKKKQLIQRTKNLLLSVYDKLIIELTFKQT